MKRALWTLVLLLGCEHRAEPKPIASEPASVVESAAARSEEHSKARAAETCMAEGAACSEHAQHAAKKEPLDLTLGAERKLGAPMTLPDPPVSVAQVLSAPDPYLGKPVKCEGKVARVCQAMGCWMELQASDGGEGLRVPMAGHSFFIPQDAVGHVAVVEGQLRRAELPAAQKQHYQGEGLQATGPLALEATSVVIR